LSAHKEAIATLVGPSGIGKSTLAMQMAMAFALGREIFGFKPRAALKILIIQGENDDGDIAEMRDGTIAGLKLTDEDTATVSANVMCCRCNSSTGRKFIHGPVRKNLERFKPDLLIIDPALCYVGGDTKEQKVVGEFLRSHLLPELQRAQCGCLLLHHTNKPPTQTTKGAANEDAYAESGSAEFRNVARAVITLRPIGDGSVFELRVPKRGNRLGWVDDCGQPTTRKYIRHSEDRNRLFWEVASGDDADKAVVAAQEDKSEANAEKVLSCIPPQPDDISQENLFAEASKLRIAAKPCRDTVKALLEDSRIICIPKPRSGARAEKFYSRVIKTSIPGGEQV